MYVCICKRVQCCHRQSIQSLNNPLFKFEFSLRDQILWRRVLLVGYIHSFSEFLKKVAHDHKISVSIQKQRSTWIQKYELLLLGQKIILEFILPQKSLHKNAAEDMQSFSWPSWEEAYSHWLHSWDLSPLCLFTRTTVVQLSNHFACL